MLKIKYDDLFSTDAELLGHGCNCYNAMGRGIAVQFKKRYPLCFDADQATKKGDINKLGRYTKATQHGKTILNIYSQFTYWDRKNMFSLKGYKKALTQIKLEFPNKTLAIPAIGMGLAHGNIKKIVHMLLDICTDYDIIMYFNDKALYNKVNQYINQ